MATFGSIWQEVRLSTGDRQDINSEIKQAVNDAVVDISLTFKVRQAVSGETRFTQLGINLYTLNATCIDVITVRNNTDSKPLIRGSYLEFASLNYANSDNYATPTKWFVDGDDLFLYNATPDETGIEFTYRYVKRFVNMVADTDVFPLPREWERPTKLMAKSYIFELLGQSEKAVAAYQQGLAVARSRKVAGGWGELLRGDNKIELPGALMSDEGY